MPVYPVQLEVTPPARYDRIQLLLRLAITITLGWIGLSAGALSGLLFLALPVLATIMITSKGSEAFMQQTAPHLWRVLTWLLSFSAYMLFVTDRFPADPDDGVRTQLMARDEPPRAETALFRLITSIPSALVLALISFVSWILVLVSIVTVLVARTVPDSIVSFQIAIVRWQARLLGYHASLVEEYPPFELDTSRGTPTHAAAM